MMQHSWFKFELSLEIRSCEIWKSLQKKHMKILISKKSFTLFFIENLGLTYLEQNVSIT